MRIPKYSRHSSGHGADRARVRLGGRTFYLGAYGSKESKAEYRRLVAEYIANDGEVIRDDAVSDLTLTEMFSAYIAWARQNYGQKATEYIKAKRIVSRVRATYSSHEAAKFGYIQFEVIRSELVAEGFTRGVVNEYSDRLVRIFKWSASRNLIPPAVPQALAMIERLKKGRTTAPDREPIGPVDAACVEATLPYLTRVVADMVRLQSVLGCRPGEVCRIQPGMVDRSGDVWEITLAEHKTAHHGKERTLYVGPRGQSILLPYLLRMSDAYCFTPGESEQQRREAVHENRSTPLSCGNRPGKNANGKPKTMRKLRECFNKDSYRQSVHSACDKAFPAPEPLARQEGESELARQRRLTDRQRDSLKAWQSDHHWNPNQIRHSFATDVRRTEGLEAARILLGHSDASITTVYAEVDRTKAIDAARRVG